MGIKTVPVVRLLKDWNRFKAGHVFTPWSIGQAKTLVKLGKAEYVNEKPQAPSKLESAALANDTETAVMETPRPRRLGRGRTIAD